MRASLTIGGIEVELSTPAGGPLETALAERYAPFLGATEEPVCSLTLEPSRAVEASPAPAGTLVERVGETTFRVVRPGLFGWFDLAGAGSIHVGASRYALDHALRLMFGLLAPRHDALLLHATSVISSNGVHVFTGPGSSSITRMAGNRPVLTDGLVLVRREPDGWMAASTPFWAAYDQPGPPRDSKLTRLWSLLTSGADGAEGSDSRVARIALLEHLFLPTAESEIHQVALRLASDLADAVPFSRLCFAGNPAVWAEIDSAVA